MRSISLALLVGFPAAAETIDLIRGLGQKGYVACGAASGKTRCVPKGEWLALCGDDWQRVRVSVRRGKLDVEGCEPSVLISKKLAGAGVPRAVSWKGTQAKARPRFPARGPAMAAVQYEADTRILRVEVPPGTPAPSVEVAPLLDRFGRRRWSVHDVFDLRGDGSLQALLGGVVHGYTRDYKAVRAVVSVLIELGHHPRVISWSLSPPIVVFTSAEPGPLHADVLAFHEEHAECESVSEEALRAAEMTEETAVIVGAIQERCKSIGERKSALLEKYEADREVLRALPGE